VLQTLKRIVYISERLAKNNCLVFWQKCTVLQEETLQRYATKFQPFEKKWQINSKQAVLLYHQISSEYHPHVARTLLYHIPLAF